MKTDRWWFVMSGETLRRVLEGYLAGRGWEQSHVSRAGVESWMAPDAGADDGIADLTTMEAVADQLRREREEATADAG